MDDGYQGRFLFTPFDFNKPNVFQNLKRWNLGTTVEFQLFENGIPKRYWSCFVVGSVPKSIKFRQHSEYGTARYHGQLQLAFVVKPAPKWPGRFLAVGLDLSLNLSQGVESSALFWA
jgi:hypothetical protein